MYNNNHAISDAVEQLVSDESLSVLFHKVRDNVPLPSNAALNEIVLLAREILFPGYFVPYRCQCGAYVPSVEEADTRRTVLYR